jgi:hypothetical protein
MSQSESFETHVSQLFKEILNMPVQEVKVPTPLPAGQYLAVIVGQPVLTQKGKKNTDCVIFPVQMLQALDQSPAFQQSLVDALKGKMLTEVRLDYTLWVTPDAAFRLKIFLLDHLGIEAGTLREAIAYAPGKQFIATISHYTTTRDGEDPRIGMEIKSTSKA